MENNTPFQTWDGGWQQPQEPMMFYTGKKELVFGFFAVVFGLLMVNSVLFYGFSLGFALAMCGCILSSAGYLVWSGCRLDGYSGTLLGLSLVITAGFARSDDGFVKFMMLCFLTVSVDLGLCLLAGQARRAPGGAASLLDAPRSLWVMGVGRSGPALRGARQSVKQGGAGARRGGAVFVGLLLAGPLLMVVVPLLVSADAAFDGLLDQLPEMDLRELLGTLMFGVFAVIVIYARGVALKHSPKEPLARKELRGMERLTVDTVLVLMSFVYLVYLFSQLAYFVGGFSGILPEEFTLAEYARRGFFEMTLLCMIDLGVIALAVGLVRKKDGKAPLSTRILCLWIGLMTVFFVVASSAKMILYIDGYGLTRLRVLTEVITVFFGLSTVAVMVWLFAPKMPYMKVIMVMGLLIGAVVFWADVDTVVASYNVSAYQSGKLETIDMEYLDLQGNVAIPFAQKLLDDDDPMVAMRAQAIVNRAKWMDREPLDLREWNYPEWYLWKLGQE